jgi:hypothetical protein
MIRCEKQYAIKTRHENKCVVNSVHLLLKAHPCIPPSPSFAPSRRYRKGKTTKSAAPRKEAGWDSGSLGYPMTPESMIFISLRVKIEIERRKKEPENKAHLLSTTPRFSSLKAVMFRRGSWLVVKSRGGEGKRRQEGCLTPRL